jgi:hypothetical protein
VVLIDVDGDIQLIQVEDVLHWEAQSPAAANCAIMICSPDSWISVFELEQNGGKIWERKEATLMISTPWDDRFSHVENLHVGTDDFIIQPLPRKQPNDGLSLNSSVAWQAGHNVLSVVFISVILIRSHKG